MSITATRPQSDTLHLALALRLDSAGAEALRQALAPERLAGVRIVRLDLGAVNYLSSAALRVFLATHKLLLARGGGLGLVAVPDYCRSVLEIAGFGGMFAGPVDGTATMRPQAAAPTTLAGHDCRARKPSEATGARCATCPAPRFRVTSRSRATSWMCSRRA